MNVFLASSVPRGGLPVLQLGFAGVTAGFAFFVWLGMTGIQKKIAEIECSSSDYTSLLEQEHTTRVSANELNEQVRSLEQTVRLFRGKLPSVADETQFLQQISEGAKAEGVSLGDFRPGGVATQKNCKAMELRLRGTGTYASLARWLHGFRDLPRMFQLSELTIVAPSVQGGDCSIDLRIDLLFGLSTEPLIASAVKS